MLREGVTNKGGDIALKIQTDKQINVHLKAQEWGTEKSWGFARKAGATTKNERVQNKRKTKERENERAKSERPQNERNQTEGARKRTNEKRARTKRKRKSVKANEKRASLEKRPFLGSSDKRANVLSE